MRHIITVLLENESGMLSRVSGLFSARGFNIESLTVATTHDDSLSKLTLVTIGSDEVVEQIIKQLNKLIDVVSVNDLTLLEHIERELLLLKIRHDDVNKVGQIVKQYNAKILDQRGDLFTLELTHKAEKIDAFIHAFDLVDLIDVSRTGVTGVALNKA